jgi:hypothetical protein
MEKRKKSPRKLKCKWKTGKTFINYKTKNNSLTYKDLLKPKEKYAYLNIKISKRH